MVQTNLQKARQAAGLTQAELAKRSGISLRTIQHYEIADKDIRKAAVETVIALADAIGCDLNEII